MKAAGQKVLENGGTVGDLANVFKQFGHDDLLRAFRQRVIGTYNAQQLHEREKDIARKTGKPALAPRQIEIAAKEVRANVKKGKEISADSSANYPDGLAPGFEFCF